MPRLALIATFAVLLSVATAVAGPREELLRVAPADAALIVIVQNTREHARNLRESPFGQWFPTTAIGKKLLGSDQVKQLHDFAGSITGQLGTTPQAILDDVLGDAIAFAYSPAPANRPNDEHAILLVRPSKPEALTKIITQLNAIQTKSGELKGVTRREYAGGEYFERKKPDGGGEFYGFAGGVFAFATSEADVRAVFDRHKAAPAMNEKAPELVTRLEKLGVANAAGVILFNPRALDTEVKAKVAQAKPDTKPFLTKFAEVWDALDAAALYLTIDKNLEVGVSLQFQPDKLPADAKKFLASLLERGTAEYLIPKDALFGVSGHVRATELIELLAALAPVEAGKPGVQDWISRTLGPVVGRNNLPLVLDALGPNWALWAEPPVKDSYLPTLVAAVELSGKGEDRAKAEKAILNALEFGVNTLRVAYNATHNDQIDVAEEKDAKTGAVILSLTNDKAFPPGFRPSFAIQRGYLVLATSPDAIKRFEAPAADGQPAKNHDTLARLNAKQTRAYLLTHGDQLAKFLSVIGLGDEKELRELVTSATEVLELVETADVILRSGEKRVQLAVRITPAKPFKK